VNVSTDCVVKYVEDKPGKNQRTGVIPESHTLRQVSPPLAIAGRYAVVGVGVTGRCGCDAGSTGSVAVKNDAFRLGL